MVNALIGKITTLIRTKAKKKFGNLISIEIKLEKITKQLTTTSKKL